MFCINCGKEIPADSAFCAFCGAKIEQADIEERTVLLDSREDDDEEATKIFDPKAFKDEEAGADSFAEPSNPVEKSLPVEQPSSMDQKILPVDQPSPMDQKILPVDQPSPMDQQILPVDQPRPMDQQILPADQPRPMDQQQILPMDQPSPAPMPGGPMPMPGGPMPMQGGPGQMPGGQMPMQGGPMPMPGGPMPMQGGPMPMQGGPGQMPGGQMPMQGGPAMQNAPVKPKSKLLKILIPICAGVTVLILGIIGFAAYSSGAFLSPGNKILLAAKNTFSEKTALISDADCIKLLNGSYSITADIGSLDSSVTYAQKSGEIQAYGNVGAYGMDIDFVVDLDKDALRLEVPSLFDDTLAYYYHDDNDGLSELGVDRYTHEALDGALDLLYKTISDKNTINVKKYARDLDKWWSGLDFEKAKKTNIKIDDANKNCSGYTVTITEDDAKELVEILADIFDDIISENYQEVFEKAGYDDYLEWVDDLEREIKGMDDIELTFYIYKNKLAAIKIKDDDERIDVEFNGGDTRWQNTKIKYDGMVALELKGSNTDGKEKYELKIEGSSAGNIEYDKKSGDISVEIPGTVNVYGNIQKRGQTIEYTIDRLSTSSYYGPNVEDLKITISGSPEFKKMGKYEINVGDPDEADDLTGLIWDLGRSLGRLGIF